jgi:dienelactone hydrolase
MGVEVSPHPARPVSRPWWAELGAVVPRSVAFARRATGHETGVPPLAVNPLAWATVAVDELAISTAYLVNRRRGVGVTDAAVADAAQTVEDLRRAGVVDDPALAYPEPRGHGAVRLSRRHRAGIEFEHLSFDSGYLPPVELPGWGRWEDGVANRQAHVYLLRRDRRPRPWVVVLHGHRMGEPRDLRLLGSRRLQQDLDVDVAHLVLPMHGPRARDGAVPFPGVDPVANFLGVAQAVWDVRTLLSWLQAEGAQEVGVYGVSLGGHVAGLLAGLDARPAAVVAGVPTSDLATMLADTVRAHWGEAAVAASHVLDDDFRTLSRLVSPLTFAPKLSRDHLFVYGAVGDRLITPQQALALWRHWDSPAILWLQGGHIINNVGASRRFVLDAFAACGVGRRTG